MRSAVSSINEELIKKYKNDTVLDREYYRAKDASGNLITLDGIVNPLRIDNRQLMAPTDDQGDIPGCAGWSACTLIESEYWKETGTIIQLDAAHVYAKAKMMDGAPNMDGTYLEYSISAALELCGNDFIQKRKVGLFYPYGKNDQRTIELTKFLIHKYDFLQAGFRIDEGWYECNNENYVIKRGGYPLGGHAVNIVGYFPEGFIIQNQWQKSWGSKGFGIMPYDLFQEQFMYGAYLEYDV